MPNLHRQLRSARLGALLVVLCPACDRSSASAEVAKAGTAPTPAAKSKDGAGAAAPPAELVLEEAELPGLGKLKMPKGYTSTTDKHWRFDLGNHESIDVSWEPHGAPSLDKARSMSNILASAETVKSATTLPSGYHEIERVRPGDGFTFIALFGPQWYVKCVAPAAKIEVCREIVRSKA